MICCECGRRMRQAAAMKATRVIGGALRAVGPLGPRCARKGLLMLPVSRPQPRRAAVLGGVSMGRRAQVVERDTRQLDWVELASA